MIQFYNLYNSVQSFLKTLYMNILIIFFVSVLLFGCEKEKVDYRDKIVRDYKRIYKHYNWEVNSTSIDLND
jgi:hypothetical protein